MILASARTEHRRLPLDADLRLHAADHRVHRRSSCCSPPGCARRTRAPTDAILGFLRDVCEPFLRIFRRVLPSLRRLRLQPDPRDHRARDPQQHRGPRHHPRLSARWQVGRTIGAAGAVAAGAALVALALVAASWSLDQLSKHAVEQLDRARRRTPPAARRAAREHPQPRRRLRLPPGQPRRRDDPDRRSRSCVLLVYFARHADTPLIWLPTGMLLGGALGNILDRAAPRLGDRLRQAPARLAAVQPRRRLDHARHPAAVPDRRARARRDATP